MSDVSLSGDESKRLQRTTKTASETVLYRQDQSASGTRVQSVQSHVSNTSILKSDSGPQEVLKASQDQVNSVAVDFNSNKTLKENCLQNSETANFSPFVSQNNNLQPLESLKNPVLITNTVQVIQRIPRTLTFSSCTVSNELQQGSSIISDKESHEKADELSINRQSIQTNKRFAALSEKYETLMANFTKDMKLRNKEIAERRKNMNILELLQLEKSGTTNMLGLLQSDEADPEEQQRGKSGAVKDISRLLQEETTSSIKPEKQKTKELSSSLGATKLFERNATQREEAQKTLENKVNISSFIHREKIASKLSDRNEKSEEVLRTLFSSKDSIDSVNKVEEVSAQEDVKNSNTVDSVLSFLREEVVGSEIATTEPEEKIATNEPSSRRKHESFKIITTTDKIEEEKRSCVWKSVSNTDYSSHAVLEETDEKLNLETASSLKNKSIPTAITCNSQASKVMSISTHDQRHGKSEKQIERTDGYSPKKAQNNAKKRKTVIAQLMLKKFEREFNYNTTHTAVGRRSKVFSTIGFTAIPRTKLEYDAAKDTMETTKINKPIKSEVGRTAFVLI